MAQKYLQKPLDKNIIDLTELNIESLHASIMDSLMYTPWSDNSKLQLPHEVSYVVQTILVMRMIRLTQLTRLKCKANFISILFAINSDPSEIFHKIMIFYFNY